MVQAKTIYVAEDGTEFQTIGEANEHERKARERSATNYTKFFTTYSGRALLKEYSLDQFGTWKVYGEDPNPDLGGPHHEPELGVLEGRLEDVIRWAVVQPNFWQWGSGGRIRKVVIRSVGINGVEKIPNEDIN